MDQLEVLKMFGELHTQLEKANNLVVENKHYGSSVFYSTDRIFNKLMSLSKEQLVCIIINYKNSLSELLDELNSDKYEEE
jgi:hypothetical protein